MSRPFDGFHHHALMFGAGSGGAAGNNLSALRDELGAIASQNHLFVVQMVYFVRTEHTDFATRLTELIRLGAASFTAAAGPSWS